MLCLFYVFTILHLGSGLKILCVFPFNARGHDMIFESLTVGLARLGHKVDVITHFPAKDPPKNYQLLVNLSGSVESLVNNYTINSVKQNNGCETKHIAQQYGNKICHLMGVKKMQDILKNFSKDPPYDLFITEVCFLPIKICEYCVIYFKL